MPPFEILNPLRANSPACNHWSASELPESGIDSTTQASATRDAHLSMVPCQENLPYFFDMTLAAIGINHHAVPEDLAQYLFSPHSLTPSVKNANPAVHFEPEHWVLILGHLNTAVMSADQLGEYLSEALCETLAEKKTGSEALQADLSAQLARADVKLDALTTQIHDIKMHHRHYRSDPDLSSMVVKLEAQQVAQRSLKKQLKSDLKQLKSSTKAWPTRTCIKQCIETIFAMPNIRTSALVLRLIHDKYAPQEQRRFEEAAQNFLRKHNVQWRPLSASVMAVLEFVSNQQNRSFSEPYTYRRIQFPGYPEKNVGDCVETSMRNFLKVILECAPREVSAQDWFASLGIDHLNPFLDFLRGNDSLEKHEQFAAMLHALPGFSPTRRSGEGCIMAGGAYDGLKQILGAAPSEIISRTGMFKSFELEPDKSMIECTTFDDTSIVLTDYVRHAELEIDQTERVQPPGFLENNADAHSVEQMSYLLLMHLGHEHLKYPVMQLLKSNKSVLDIATLMQQWHLVIRAVQPTALAHPAQLLVPELEDVPFRLTMHDARRCKVDDAYKTLEMVARSKHAPQALISILGPELCAKHFKVLLADANLFRAFNEALDACEAFQREIMSRIDFADVQAAHPVVLQNYRYQLAKLSDAYRPFALAVASFVHRFGVALFAQPVLRLVKPHLAYNRVPLPENTVQMVRPIAAKERVYAAAQLALIGMAAYVLGRQLLGQAAANVSADLHE